MEPSAARSHHRRCLSVAVPLFPVARRHRCGVEAQALADLRPRRIAGRGRLVDGGLGPLGAGRGLAISPRHASGAGAADLCGHRLDLATTWRAIATPGVIADEDHGRSTRDSDLRAALPWRAG